MFYYIPGGGQGQPASLLAAAGAEAGAAPAGLLQDQIRAALLPLPARQLYPLHRTGIHTIVFHPSLSLTLWSSHLLDLL